MAKTMRLALGLWACLMMASSCWAQELHDHAEDGVGMAAPLVKDPVARIECSGFYRFLAPKEEGAYRVFATLQNQHGQTSVANIPFLCPKITDQPTTHEQLWFLVFDVLGPFVCLLFHVM
jgi:hypothetical protein